MNDSQITYGEQKLKELARTLNLSNEQTLLVLSEVQSIKNFYNWVNADAFINLKITK